MSDKGSDSGKDPTAGVSLQNMVHIRVNADRANPGCSSRVSASDFEAIVVAVVRVLGIPNTPTRGAS